MRLLNVNTFEFCRFPPNDAPKYAVASHRWGPDEAAYKDVLKKRNLGTLGYKKVEAFCAFVQRWDRNIEWLWIDTCCIDKKSSAEESEAINSMYHYYSRAVVCIAFLGDVASLEAYGDNEAMLMEAFETSVWFTRGWTLQELLAPTTVVFTTSSWEVIGYKTQADPNGNSMHYGPEYGRFLNHPVANITGIPEYILWDFPRSRSLSVQERMGWMTKRTTTRVEDMAYCLLGIFGVHMALIYGEGEGAMARLEEEVRKRENMSVAGSVWGGDDSRSVAAPSVYGADRRVDSPPPMPPPTRAMTMQASMGSEKRTDDAPAVPAPEYTAMASPMPPPMRAMTLQSGSSDQDWRAMKKSYKEAKRQAKGDARSTVDARTVIGAGSVVGPGMPERSDIPETPAPPPPGGLDDRVNAWREQTLEPAPSAADDGADYDDGDDTETLVSWNTAPSDTSTSLTRPSQGRGQPSPPVDDGAFQRAHLQDLSEALPPPPPYPGTIPRANTSSSQEDGPSMGISRAQTLAPSTVDSTATTATTTGRPDLKTKILLRRLEAERAKRAAIERHRGSEQGPSSFAPPSRSQTFATSGADDLESIAPDDSASMIGGGPSPQVAGGIGQRGGFLRRLTEERERQRSQSSRSPSEVTSPPPGISRSQTFAGRPLDVLSNLGSEVLGPRKALRQLLSEEKAAYREARRAMRRGGK